MKRVLDRVAGGAAGRKGGGGFGLRERPAERDGEIVIEREI
jgi:hypothetical protein